MAAMGRLRPVVTVRDFPLRQPAMLTRTAEIGQKQPFHPAQNFEKCKP
jgi:hypothetical protein